MKATCQKNTVMMTNFSISRAICDHELVSLMMTLAFLELFVNYELVSVNLLHLNYAIAICKMIYAMLLFQWIDL
jgi:hypothetical protein